MAELAGNTRDYWEFFAGETVRLKAPLYTRLTHGVHDDPDLLALAAKGRPGQPAANLLFGAVHYLLLRGAHHPLSRHYRTLTPDADLAAGDPFPLFRAFCREHEREIAALIAAKVTNTNEVGRSAFLRAGFLAIAAECETPLHLIELGSSAGLNLHWHRYGYRYVAASTVHRTGVAGAALTLETALKGPGLPPLGENPAIGISMGLERDPVDLSNADARDWLMALVWPDHRERFQRLKAALQATRGLPLDIRTGDALDLLPEALAQCPKAGTPVVFPSLVTYQFPKPDRQTLDDMLVVAGLRRPVFRLSLEWDGKEYPLKATRYDGGAKQVRLLALCDPHGGSMEWRDEKSP